MAETWVARPLKELSPSYTEFTGTKGVLRVLRPDEESTRATGLIFKCPHCLNSKTKQHMLIFLFHDERVPPEARPLGRFLPRYRRFSPIPEEISSMTLEQVSDSQVRVALLKPQDVCGWTGTLLDGVVRYQTRRKGFMDWIKWRS